MMKPRIQWPIRDTWKCLKMSMWDFRNSGCECSLPQSFINQKTARKSRHVRSACSILKKMKKWQHWSASIISIQNASKVGWRTTQFAQSAVSTNEMTSPLRHEHCLRPPIELEVYIWHLGFFLKFIFDTFSSPFSLSTANLLTAVKNVHVLKDSLKNYISNLEKFRQF